MPIYEYACKSCGHEFEELVASHRDQAPACPKCAAEVEKKFSMVGGIQSGGGGGEPSCCGSQNSECAAGGCPMARGMG